jgi:AcrR family transcriptional regulator
LPRGTLSDEQILEAAGELAASRGIDAFTMPDVAKRLGVKVTNVYWYFRTRDDLVGALADRATREFYEGLDYDGELEGDDRVLEHFFLYWRRLRANRLWREVFIHSVRRTISTSAEVQGRANRVWSLGVARIVDAGLSPPDALRAYTILSAYTRGYVLVQQFQDDDGVSASPEPQEELLAFLQVHGLATQPDPEQTFEVGLRALWAGLSASVGGRGRLETGPPAANRVGRGAPGA